MKLGEGQAIFTAECTHSFHFHCITSSVKHGNQVCPICRANWKEIPHQSPPANLQTIMPQDDDDAAAVMTLIRRLPPSILVRPPPSLRSPEPALYNDDESLVVQLDAQPVATSDDITSSNLSATDGNTNNTIEIKTYPEFSSLERRKPYDYFTILIHLKAPMAINTLQNPRTPVDLVTILDISGSMSGTKLTLLKRAMGFVIQNLTPNDRLSVIAFSSTARRLFPLRRMSDTGRQHALHSVNTLTANGATNIAEGLRKGAKVMEQRREKNPVASIILLSDGQDTCTLNGFGVVGSSRRKTERNYQLLLPVSLQQGKDGGLRIPIHTFGFGADHDAGSMHSISECTGGMFSFIESEIAIQDAFAQCIGGILSVVVQNLIVGIECCCCTHDLGGRLLSIKAGSYPSSVYGDGRSGSIDVGDLYADEERDFLISMSVPPEFNSDSSSTSASLLRVKCEFTDPRTNKPVTLYGDELKIERTDAKVNREVCLEVDRQRNRVRAAEAMTEARSAAERGDLGDAIAILEECRSVMAGTKSGKCGGDKMCVGLDVEMKEMQERMESKKVYENSGRAYVLSGLSSHSWQRATVRGVNDCRPNDFSYTVILDVLVAEGKLGKLDEVVEISKKYMTRSIFAYLVKTLGKLGHASEAHRMYCNMWEVHDQGDRDACISMLECLCGAGKTSEAIDLLDKIHEKGIVADIKMYNTILSSLGRFKRIPQLHNLYVKMKSDSGPKPDIFSYNILISSFGRAGEVDEAMKVFEELEGSDCVPDVISYNSLINCLGKNGDIDEAHMRFKEMQEKGLSPDVVTYSTLIECFGKTDKVEMACSLFDEMIADGCSPNIVTYNILLDCLEKNGKTGEAMDLYVKLKEQGLTPDSITYSVLERLQSSPNRVGRVRKQNPIKGWIVSPLM